jgi:Ca2+-dependent lipid-binding protein
MSHQVQVTIVKGRNLTNKEMMGKQDPFVKFGFDFKNGMQKTNTHQKGGKEPQWNQSFTLVSSAPELFVEAYDEDPTSNDLIGFAAIPMQQVFQAGPSGFNGWFRIYNSSGKEQGELHIMFSPPGSNCKVGETQGMSQVNDAHKKHVSSHETKKTVAQVGVGAALVGGAALLGGHLFNENKKHQQEEREKEDRFRQEEQRLNEEKQRLEDERRRMDQQQPHHGGGGYQQSGHGGGCGEWDPVGTYSPGQRVNYNGRAWECLQGHTSNPTWQPGVAHSLWRAC